jgi:hypothetical protein
LRDSGGCTEVFGASGENARVTHRFQPSARFGRELPIGLHVGVALQVAGRKEVTNLRAHSDDTRLEVAQDRRLALVGGELLVEIANRSDMQLLGDELRCAPIEVPIDAALIIGMGVVEIVGHAVAEARVRS